MSRLYIPGVPSGGHISDRGYWHPGPDVGCVKCEPPRTFTVPRKDVDRCPRRSLAPSHYRNDGTCLCRKGGEGS